MNEYNDLIKNNINIIIPNNVDITLNDFFTNIKDKDKKEYFTSLNNIKYNIFYDLKKYYFFIYCVNNANKKIIASNNLLFKTNKFNIWNIFIYKNMMWDLPFTLEDIIFIPEKYLNSCYQNNNYNTFIKTLIHERIHISQRENEILWNDFIIKDNKNWIKITSNSTLFKFLDTFDFGNLFNKIIVLNPDSYYKNFKYIYKLDNQYYYGLLILESNNILTKWVKININTFQIEKLNYNILNHEHPYEIYAYQLSDNINESVVNGNTF